MGKVSILKPGHVYSVDLGDGEPVIINFQDGPIKEVGVNGIQNEDLLEILINRVSYLNSKFTCPENMKTIASLQSALWYLEQRTANRESRGVEGKNLQ